MSTKEQVRKQVALLRKELDSEWQESASQQIRVRLQDLNAFQSAQTVALYLAIAGEVKLDDLLAISRGLDKQTCVPVFNAEQNCYDMAEITADTRFKTGNYGIREPVSTPLLPLDKIDLIVVPGVAFDLQGNRLGRGGGYYDRLLDGFTGKSVAVAFDFQIFPSIPTDLHDKPVNFVITETKSIKV